MGLGNFIKRLQLFNQAPTSLVRTPVHQGTKRSPAEFKLKLGEFSTVQKQQYPWLAIVHESADITPEMMAMAWQVPVGEAITTLNFFAVQGLLIPENEALDRFSLTSDLRALAFHLLTSSQPSTDSILRLDIPWVKAQQLFLERGLQTLNSQSSWVQAYWAEHLPWHLKQANQIDRIHRLLQDYPALIETTWVLQYYPIEAKVGCEAEVSPLLCHGMALAKQGFADDPLQQLSLQSQYALLLNKTRLEIQSLPHQWVCQLIQQGLWHPTQGLRYLKAHHDPERRALIIESLAAVFPPQDIGILLQEAARLSSDSAQAIALRGLYPHLEIKDKQRAFQLIQSMASEYYQSLSIGAFAPYLPLPLMIKTLERVRQFAEDSALCHALLRLIPQLTRPLLKQTLGWVKKLPSPLTKLKLEMAMISVFPELKPEICDQFLNVLTLEDQSEVLGEMLTIDPTLFPRIVDLIRQTSDEVEQGLLIHDCINHCAQTQLDEFWQIALNMQNEGCRAQALSSLLPHYDHRQQPQALQALAGLQSPEAQAHLLSQLGLFMSVSDFPFLQKRILKLEDLSLRTEALVHFCQYYPAALPSTKTAIDAIADPLLKLQRQGQLLGLDPNLKNSYLKALAHLEDEPMKASLLTQAIPELDPEALEDALALIMTLKSDMTKNWALNHLADHLSPQQLLTGTHDILKSVNPQKIFENMAKQINRCILETPENIPTKNNSSAPLAQEILALDPHQASVTHQNNKQIFQMILETEDVFYRARLMGLFLHEIDWAEMDLKDCSATLDTLMQGSPAAFFEMLPPLCMGLLSQGGRSVLRDLWNCCERISLNLSVTQSRVDTFCTIEPPPKMPKTL